MSIIHQYSIIVSGNPHDGTMIKLCRFPERGAKSTLNIAFHDKNPRKVQDCTNESISGSSTNFGSLEETETDR